MWLILGSLVGAINAGLVASGLFSANDALTAQKRADGFAAGREAIGRRGLVSAPYRDQMVPATLAEASILGTIAQVDARIDLATDQEERTLLLIMLVDLYTALGEESFQRRVEARRADGCTANEL